MSSEVTAVVDKNTNTETAWACTVYSMVPYLGILFVPFALAVSGYGFVRARQRASDDHRRFLLCVGLSLLIFSIQLLLWWLLYFIPKIGV